MATTSFALLAVTFLMAACSAAPNGAKLSLKIPESCKDKGFCPVKPEGYDEMEKIINSLLPKNLIPTNMADRDGDAAELEELSPESDWHNCPYRKQVITGYLYRWDNDTKVDIIIQTALLSQTVEHINCATDKIEASEDGTQQCFKDLGLGAFGMKTTCQTSTVERILYVFDPEKKDIQPKKFNIPCCCSCKITTTF